MAALSAKALASTWSDSGLTRLSRCIVDWESIAPVLSITEAEEREIKEDSPHDYQMQKYVMLRKWKAKVGDGATYGQLIRVFRSMRERWSSRGKRAGKRWRDEGLNVVQCIIHCY